MRDLLFEMIVLYLCIVPSCNSLFACFFSYSTLFTYFMYEVQIKLVILLVLFFVKVLPCVVLVTGDSLFL